MSIASVYTELLTTRGTFAPAPNAHSIAELLTVKSDIPSEILELLNIQDGEDTLLTYWLGYEFRGASSIAANIKNLREMVEVDETLPAAFLEFVPFLHTGVKSDVGIFTLGSSIMPGEIVEYHYETGEFIRWAYSMEVFLSALNGRAGVFARFGTEFPAEGREVIDLRNYFPLED